MPGTGAGFGCPKVSQEGSVWLPGARRHLVEGQTRGSVMTKAVSAMERDRPSRCPRGQGRGGFPGEVLPQQSAPARPALRCRKWSDSGGGRRAEQNLAFTACEGGTKDVFKVSCLSSQAGSPTTDLLV